MGPGLKAISALPPATLMYYVNSIRRLNDLFTLNNIIGYTWYCLLTFVVFCILRHGCFIVS